MLLKEFRLEGDIIRKRKNVSAASLPVTFYGENVPPLLKIEKNDETEYIWFDWS